MATFSLAGLGGLHLWAGEPRGSRVSGDALAISLLRAEVDRRPDDAEARCRLAREQLALGLPLDAERTLAPLVREGAPAREVALLALDTAVAAWRAAARGNGERRSAQAAALARLESFLPHPGNLDELAHLARVARELGRPDLAARAYERAAVLEADPRLAVDLGLEAVDAYRSADRGAQALQLAEGLVERFPAQRSVLERAEAVALAQNAPDQARRLGERLIALGALDSVSLGRQLDLDLAAGDLAGTSNTAERLVAGAPDDPAARLTAANVASWAGRPSVALRHFLWLARHGAGGDAGDRALALARGLGDEAAVAQILLHRSRRHALPAGALVELADALASTASRGADVAALRDHAASHPDDRTAWEVLAATLERRRDLAGALAARLDCRDRFGGDIASSVAVARLEWAAGRSAKALAELRQWSDSAPAEATGYWELLAEIAWHEEDDALALRAYRALWEAARIDSAGAERFMLLARASGRSDDLIRFGRAVWSPLKQPRLLVLAMDEAARTDRWGDLEAMAAESSASANAFAAIPSYWMLRARLDERGGRIAEALAAYRHALAADPKSKAARSGVIWLLAGAHERESLSRSLAAWAADASRDPDLSPAFAAGLEELSTSPQPAARQVARAIGAEAGAESIAGVVLSRQRAFLRSELAGGELDVGAGVLSFLSAGNTGLRMPDAETLPFARFTFPGLGGRNDVTAGASLRSDGNVPHVIIGHTSPLASVGEARLSASFQEPADESLPLRMSAVRTRIGGAAGVSEGRAYQRVALEWKRWSGRGGDAIGRGAALNFEIGWRTQAPDLVLRLQGGYQRNSLGNGPLPAPLAIFDAETILPSELLLLGAGAGAPSIAIGPLRLAADAWVGVVSPRIRPAFRVQTGLAVAPYQDGDLAVTAFAANDRWAAGGNLGLSVSLTHHFGR